MVLQDSMPPDEVRAPLGRSFRECHAAGDVHGQHGRRGRASGNSVYKIDAGLDVDRAARASHRGDVSGQRGKSLLLSYAMEFADVKQLADPATARPVSRCAAASENSPRRQPPPAEARRSAGRGDNRRTPATDGKPAAQPARSPCADHTAAAGRPGRARTSRRCRPDARRRSSTRRDSHPPVDLACRGAGTCHPIRCWPGRASGAGGAGRDCRRRRSLSSRRPMPPRRRHRRTPRPPPPAGGRREDAGRPRTPPPAADSGADQTAADRQRSSRPRKKLRSVAHFTFGDAINAPTLRDNIKRAYNEVHPAAKPRRRCHGGGRCRNRARLVRRYGRVLQLGSDECGVEQGVVRAA